MKILNKLVVFCSFLAASNVLAGNTPGNVLSAKETVEKFCSSEFNGIQDIRLEMAKYSQLQEIKEKKRDPEFAGMVRYWQNDPLYVASSYRILNLSIRKNRAVATIAYTSLARTKGNGVLGRRIIPLDVENDIINLHLVFMESKWWILDPPIPRISLEAIIKYYTSNINIMGDGFLERSDVSAQQKKYYQNLQENLQLLKSLQHS